MNPNQLSSSNYVSGANVSVAATSLLPNGNLELLAVHIFDKERMGVLVSFYVALLTTLTIAHLF
jgi:hypothetical protein